VPHVAVVFADVAALCLELLLLLLQVAEFFFGLHLLAFCPLLLLSPVSGCCCSCVWQHFQFNYISCSCCIDLHYNLCLWRKSFVSRKKLQSKSRAKDAVAKPFRYGGYMVGNIYPTQIIHAL